MEQVSGLDSPPFWKGRLLSLGIVFVLGFVLILGWVLWKGSRTPPETSPGPVTLEAALPRYETAEKNFTVRFTVQSSHEIKGPLYLFIVSDLPLNTSSNTLGTVAFSKGKTIHFVGRSSIKLSFDGLRVDALPEGGRWVAEASLNLKDVGSHVLAYWFGTDEMWGNALVSDGVIPEGVDAKRFLPALKDFPFHLGTIQVVTPQQGELLELADKALGQTPDGLEDYRSSSFCKMGFGEDPLQVAKVLSNGKSTYYLFGKVKGELQKKLVAEVARKPLGPPRTLFSPALGKDLLLIEEGKTPGEKVAFFGWLDGKVKEALVYQRPPQSTAIHSLFITKDGTLHVIHEGVDGKEGSSYLLETYDWNFEKGHYSVGRSHQASYAEFLIESGDYQDFLTRGFTRPHLESLLDYFTNANNEGSTRNGIHNLLVTAAGSDYGDDKDAWRKWFSENQKKFDFTR